VIRVATQNDALNVTALIVTAYSHYVERLGQEPQPMTDDYPAMIQANQVHVAEADGCIVGVLVTQEKPDCLLIRTVAVNPGSQRKGFGIKLLSFAETLAWDMKKNRIKLYTNEVMDGTFNLYSCLGYWVTHRDGLAGKQVIYMEKEVPIDRTSWYGIIVTDPAVCAGKPRFARTRHYIDVLLAYLEAGKSFDDIVEEYSDLNKEQLAAMMGFVRDVVAAKRNQLKSDR
jgi:uncharacterized protein (DUF433 family)/N-acetylglutamate synthase-like GNAT family acetyltransferase